MPAPQDPEAPGGVREDRDHVVLRWLAPAGNPAGAVFGLITIGVLLAVESARHDTYEEVVLSSLIALTLYWFAHAYADLLGLRLELRRRLTPTAVGHALARDWTIVTGAAIPLITVLVCWAVGLPCATAVLDALWVSASLLVLVEVAAGFRAHASPRELLLEGCVGAAMGIAVIALRLVLI